MSAIPQVRARLRALLGQEITAISPSKEPLPPVTPDPEPIRPDQFNAEILLYPCEDPGKLKLTYPVKVNEFLEIVSQHFLDEADSIEDFERLTNDDPEKAARALKDAVGIELSDERIKNNSEALVLRNFELLYKAIKTLQQEDASFTDVERSAALIRDYGPQVLKDAALYAHTEAQMSADIDTTSDLDGPSEITASHFMLAQWLNDIADNIAPLAKQLQAGGRVDPGKKDGDS